MRLDNMNTEPVGYLFAFLLAVAIFCLIEVGRRVGSSRLTEEGESYTQGIGALESAVFALLGLLLAFSFSGALARFDYRRQLVITEVNAIGTAWLRIDLLPDDAKATMRDLFRRYLDTRVSAYQRLPDVAAFNAELAKAGNLQGEIWTLAVPASARASSPDAAQMLLLDALNTMFDITTTRTEAFRIHTPMVIFWMLGALSLSCALFAGYDMARRKRRNLLHSVAFTLVLSLTVYVIIDLEYPRFGLINMFDSDQVLADLRKTME